ncbi:Putative thylakoid membrane protein containing 8 pentapeptide repeat [Geitlerinema sp. FC II]|uniref:pentapeptide repeat-containing protein n=1 Tax=Baaleninema simplex TaxID=2862350 RepID=UPI00034A1605|nr:pentapeptide repeat-containing protein [Baaleninema simplex]MDC0832870.1 pentapeptide repeat-containing protein [Geitlerinema sp. CS-897]PPT05740.1 Putative thylakoid membrane protein containing 8 pentapeptide repeat [Geitlerinema sp. FC II]
MKYGTAVTPPKGQNTVWLRHKHGNGCVFGDRVWRRLCAIVLCVGFLFLADVALYENPAQAADYVKETLFGEDFSGQDLTDSNFTLSTIRSSDFSHANLVGVQLFRTKFKEVTLENADLRFATLDSAVFIDSSLKNALLEGAFAYNAQFKNTNIEGADFTDAFLRDDTQAELCAIASGTNPVTERQTRETLMCDYL